MKRALLVLLLATGVALGGRIIGSHRFKVTWSDDFNRADAGTLGANWQQTYSESGGVIALVSNQAKSTNQNNGAMAVVKTAVGTWPSNQASQVTFISITGAYQMNLIVRATQASPLSAYFAIIDGVNWTIYEFTAGSGATLTNGTTTAPSNGDIYRFEASGTSLTLKRNGSTIGSTTDSTTTTGNPGFGLYTATTATVVIDNFSAEGL